MGKSTLKAEKTLLWTNPNPTSNFSAQTISLDLSNYDEVEVEAIMYMNGTTAYYNSFRCKVGKSYTLNGISYKSNVLLTRDCKVQTSSVYFDSGWANGANDGAVIPTRIYGIK